MHILAVAPYDSDWHAQPRLLHRPTLIDIRNGKFRGQNATSVHGNYKWSHHYCLAPWAVTRLEHEGRLPIEVAATARQQVGVDSTVPRRRRTSPSPPKTKKLDDSNVAEAGSGVTMSGVVVVIKGVVSGPVPNPTVTPLKFAAVSVVPDVTPATDRKNSPGPRM